VGVVVFVCMPPFLHHLDGRTLVDLVGGARQELVHLEGRRDQLLAKAEPLGDHVLGER
jgi:hypothetical protein